MPKRQNKGEKIRRRPKDNKFLKAYYIIRDEILYEGVIEHSSFDDGREDCYEEYQPTKNRLLYRIFEVFGSRVISYDDMMRIKNITTNKIQIHHDQILARNIFHIVDAIVKKLVYYKPGDTEKLNKKYPFNLMSKKDIDYFEKDMDKFDVKVFAKKYCRLSKIIERLPKVEYLAYFVKYKKSKIYKLMVSPEFVKYVVEIFDSWVEPMNKKLKDNSVKKRGYRNKDTIELAKNLRAAFIVLFGDGYVTNHDSNDYKRVTPGKKSDSKESANTNKKSNSKANNTNTKDINENNNFVFNLLNELNSSSESIYDREFDDNELRLLDKAIESRKNELKSLEEFRKKITF